MIKNNLTVSTIEIETITKCNRKCIYCPQNKYDRGNHLMNTNLFKKIIDELSEIKFNGRIFPHLYGEPLLDKRLSDLIKYTRKKLPGVNITIVSNGDLLTISLFNKLIEQGVDYFNITQHDKSMSKNMRLLFNYIKNKPQLKNKIQYHKITSEFPLFNRGGHVSPAKLIKFKTCARPSSLSVVIDYNGNVILCCNDYFSSVIFGNLKKESLMQIWNKPYYQKLRKDLKNGKFELDICKRCVGLR